jgi:hypothetical protein
MLLKIFILGADALWLLDCCKPPPLGSAGQLLQDKMHEKRMHHAETGMQREVGWSMKDEKKSVHVLIPCKRRGWG